MSDKSKKSLSLSDIDMGIDLDMEKIAKNQPRNDVFRKKEKMQDTLDLYKDEMSRVQVEKLLRSHTGEAKSIDEINEDIVAANREVAAAEALMQDGIGKEEEEYFALEAREALTKDDKEVDYLYMFSLLNESKREHEEEEGEYATRESRRASKSYPRKKESGASYTSLRIFFASVVTLFLFAFAALTFVATTVQRELRVANTEIEKLKAGSEEYERLKIDMDAMKTERDRLESDNDLLRFELAQLRNNSTEGGSGTASSEQSNASVGGDEKYTVRRGDSLWRISAQFYQDGSLYREIMTANNLRSESDIYPGMELIIPSLGGTHGN